MLNFFRLTAVAAFAVGTIMAAAADVAPADAARLVSDAYRHPLIQQLSVADEKSPAWAAAIERCPPSHRDALAFLLVNMPTADLKSVSPDRLLGEVALAYEAREATPWARAVPEDVFLNHVLPYACTSEPRDPWRADFRERFAPLVADCTSAGDAAQKLNRDVFKSLGVAYHATKRDKPDQSPAESIRIGFASCTGLSVLLIDACRSVGVPARLVGVPMWRDDSGNHTWVEVYDRGQWHFVGAAEPGPLDDTWFAAKAAKADAANPKYAVYAASFKRTATPFPAVWSAGNRELYADNVTARYAPPAEATPRSSTARGADAVAGLVDDLKAPPADRTDVTTRPFADTPLTKAQAAMAAELLRDDRLATLRAERADEWKNKAVVRGDKTMRFNTKAYGEKPAAGWPLLIVLHGGGNTTKAVNDQQWSGMNTLYQPANTFVIAPRAPTDTWNLWHEPHIDPMLDRLIEDAVVLEGIDPDHVYLTGYSAGGDGVYQLAPRLADRFAAAAMMAGHPNDASPLNLRNLPFALHVGALDAAYKRNDVAREWGEKLDALQKADPGGYTHQVQLHEGREHWMNREDAVAIAWMQPFTRNAVPTKVVWEQGNVPHDRFYWLAAPSPDAKKGQRLTVTRDGQTITIDEAINVTAFDLLLSDDLLDLDKPVRVTANGHVIAERVVPRTIGGLSRSLAERPIDPHVFAARLRVELPK